MSKFSTMAEIDKYLHNFEVPKDKVIITYSPADGLFLWFCELFDDPYDYESADFLLKHLNEDQGKWWLGRGDDEIEHRNYDAYSIDTESGVDFGPHWFALTYDNFEKHLKELKSSEIVIDLTKYGIDVKPEKAMAVATGVVYSLPYQTGEEPIDPEYQVTYKVRDHEFVTMEDVKKFIAFDKLSKIVGDGTINVIKFKSEVIKLLGEL